MVAFALVSFALVAGTLAAMLAGGGGAIAATRASDGGTLTVGAYHDDFFDSIDTNIWDGGISWSVARLVCVPLVWYPNAGGAAGQTLVPGLAAAMPKISADGRTYTFTIRAGLRFSNGAPLTAQDIKYTFYRMFKVNPGTLVTNIEGAAAVSSGKATSVSGVVADGNKLVVHLDARNGAFLEQLSQMYTCPVPNGTPAKANEKGTLPATGPYMIQSYTPNQQIVLVRNPDFDPALGPRGHADRIVFNLAVDETQALTKIKLGQLDTLVEGLPPSDALLAKSDPSLAGHVFSHGTATLIYLWMNTDVAPFNNADVRQAVNYALDRSQIVKVSGGTGAADAWTQMLPPALVGSFRPIYPLSPDLTKAKALMKASGLKLPLSTTVYTATVAGFPLAAQVVQQDLKQIGINLTIHLGSATVISAYVGVRSHHAPMGFGVWSQDYPDGGDFMQLVDPVNANDAGSHAHFHAPGIESRFAAASAQTGAAREQSYQRLADEIQRQYAPWAPLYVQAVTQATSSSVSGYQWQVAQDLPVLTGLSKR
jgi:ABC-type transport system substrate-binding protein